MSSGFGAGLGADMLQDIIRQKVVEAYKQQELQQEQQRLRQEQQRINMAAADRMAAQKDLAQTREQNAVKSMLTQTPPGTNFDPETAGRVRAAGFGSNVQHNEADLPSRAISGIADAGKAAPSMGPLRMVSAGRPERDTFTGTAEQLADEQKRTDALAKEAQARADKAAKPTTQPVVRIGRNGQLQQIGDAPIGAHFVTEPAPTGGGEGRALTPTAEANLTQKLAGDWQKVSAASREMDRQYNLMETGINRFRQGDKNGGSQAVLVTFQKILDPTSVVRESEYARSASGVSLLQRMQGYAEKLAAGGAGVPESALQEMVNTAKEFVTHSRASAEGQRKRIAAFADKYNIPHELVFDDNAPSGGGAVATGGAGAAPKRIRYDMNGNPIKD